MRLEKLLSGQLRQAIQEGWPLVIPAGTIEYHGEHLGYGTDTLAVIGVLELLEREIDLVIAPPFYYGPSSYAVAGPERGTIDVDPDNFERHVRDVLWGLLEIGFRNIFVIIHHQYENGIEMPEALAFKKAAKQLTFRFLEKTGGRGWWGSEDASKYYETLDTKDNPFNWIKVIPLMSPSVQAATGYDHAGLYETSLLMALYPEAVDMSKFDAEGPWFTRTATGANVDLGRRMVELILEDLRNKLTGRD